MIFKIRANLIKGEVRSPMSNRSYKVLLSVAVVGVLLAIMIFPISLFAHEEEGAVHPADDHVHYPENSSNLVRDFDSEDPESADIIWSIRGVDEADFTIDGNGVLRFKSVSPTSRTLLTDRELFST